MADTRDCRGCKHYQACNELCPPMSRLMDKPLRERLMADYGDRAEMADYKAVINELAANYEAKEAKKAHLRVVRVIRSIADARLQLIAAADYAGLTQSQIADGLNLSIRQVKRLMSPSQKPVNSD